MGVESIKGNFEKDDIVLVFGCDGIQLGVGKSQYSSKEARNLMGQKGEKPIVHYDYLYLFNEVE